MPNELNDIDTLMLLDPLDLSTDQLNEVYGRIAGLPATEMTPRNIDQIIEYQRRARAAYASGEKPKKGEGIKVDLSGIQAALVKPKAMTDRRF